MLVVDTRRTGRSVLINFDQLSDARTVDTHDDGAPDD